MTREQAADRLTRMANLRDAKEACDMGAMALLDQPWVITAGILIGFILGALFVAVLYG